MPWQIVIFLSLSLDQLPTRYYLHFHCCEVSLRFPFMWNFCWCYFLWDIFTLFIIATLPIYVTKFGFICSSHGIQESLKQQQHQYFRGQLFLLWLHLCWIWVSHPTLSFLFHCCIFIFLGQLPLVIITWVYHWDTRRQHGYMLCCLCVWPE